MTRIALDARYLRGRPSGIGAYVRAVAERLPALRPEWAFDLWLPEGAPPSGIAGPNVQERRVAAPPNSLPTLLWPARLADLSGVDAFHAPFNILGRGVPCPAVTTVHDIMWVLQPALCEGRSPVTPFLAAFYTAGIRNAILRSRRLIAISAATADTIVAYHPPARDRLRVIHHGIEARFRPAADLATAQAIVARSTGDERPYFLVVGQNAPYKNHEGVLEAFAAANLPRDVRLIMLQRLYLRGRFGLSREPALLRLARRLGIEDRVRFLEGVSDDDILALYQAALGLVQYSRFEGFGMPALEACAAGCPVLASDIAPLVEVLGGAGLHATLDPRDLARQLERVATEPALRDELRGRGLERAAGFSWDRCAAQHAEVYGEALG